MNSPLVEAGTENYPAVLVGCSVCQTASFLNQPRPGRRARPGLVTNQLRFWGNCLEVAKDWLQ